MPQTLNSLILTTLVATLVIINPETSAASEATKAEITSTLYQLSFTDTKQQQVILKRYKGKVILLNFWATWCPPCVKEMPSMERLRQHFQGTLPHNTPFEVVAINAGEQPEAVNRFLNKMKEKGTELTFPVLLDSKGRSFREFGLKGLPMSFIFNANGQRVKTIGGGIEWDEPEQIQMIKKILLEQTQG
ncbi:MAG: TlpA family protein disulfide reductase [Marinobacterium sp.]|nr:TlpA family protein disulfide reductase [Marinobacterium sp.]